MTTKEKQALEDRGLIRGSLPDKSEVPDGQPNKHLVVTVPETSNGQADKLPQNGQ
jgi:hypothetical protein